jgi:hypothetical protein
MLLPQPTNSDANNQTIKPLSLNASTTGYSVECKKTKKLLYINASLITIAIPNGVRPLQK